MALKDDFELASRDVKTLSKRPDNDTLLQLYSHFKQATEGDVAGSRPGMLDVKGRKKYDAWAALKGKSSETAMTQYIAIVKRIQQG